jgi:hypothetical protein
MKRVIWILIAAILVCLLAITGCKKQASAPTQWTQVPFEASGNWAVLSLETFKGNLYSASADCDHGLTIRRLKSDGTWAQASEYGFGNSQLSTPWDMISFKDMLYVSAMDFCGRLQSGHIWRSADGSTWEPVTTDGFGNTNINSILNFAIFKDMLYVTAGGNLGMEIWRSSNGAPDTWKQVVTANSMGDNLASGSTSFIVYKESLYAIIGTDGAHPARVWRTSNGDTWTAVTDNGFGDVFNIDPGGAAIFKDYLYVGMMNKKTVRIGQIWRTKDGSNWEKVVADGFGNPNNVKVDSLYTYEGQLYAGTWNEDEKSGNNAEGLQIWRSPDGLHWTQVNVSGFGDANNWVTHLSVDVAAFQDSLYYGTWNWNGGQIWKLSR